MRMLLGTSWLLATVVACGGDSFAGGGDGPDAAADGSAAAGGAAGSGASGGSSGTGASSGAAGSAAGASGSGTSGGRKIAGSSGGEGGAAGEGGSGGESGFGGSAGVGAAGSSAGASGSGGGSAGGAGVGGSDAGGSGGDAGAGGFAGRTCSELGDLFRSALAAAKSCNPNIGGLCTVLVDDAVECACSTFVNHKADVPMAQMEAIKEQYARSGCSFGICPAIVCALPTSGECDAGTGMIGSCRDHL